MEVRLRTDRTGIFAETAESLVHLPVTPGLWAIGEYGPRRSICLYDWPGVTLWSPRQMEKPGASKCIRRHLRQCPWRVNGALAGLEKPLQDAENRHFLAT